MKFNDGGQNKIGKLILKDCGDCGTKPERFINRVATVCWSLTQMIC
jgi:hypothetical protein